MKFRKKHREQSEVFTDSLNDILFILLMFFLITTTMANPNVVKVNNPRGTKDTKAKQNIVVSINKDQQFFIGQKQVEPLMLDSLIKFEVEKLKNVAALFSQGKGSLFKRTDHVNRRISQMCRSLVPNPGLL